MIRTIHLIGINHRVASIDIREKFALNLHTSKETWPFLLNKDTPCACSNKEDVPQGTATDPVNKELINNELINKEPYHEFMLKHPLEESLILSTCNRVEIVAIYEGSYEDLVRIWCATVGQNVEDLMPYVYHYEGTEAITHLFSVASSLDSLVLGEPQILGQLKIAYSNAVKAGHAGLIINRLLHKAFSVAKRVRTETGVASSAVSISYAAVELAKRIFEDMHKHEALLIGAGEMAELAATHLVNAGIKKLKVVNRTFSRAEDLANRMGAEAWPFDQLEECLVHSDIVISSTGSQETILQVSTMEKVLKKRKYRPIFFIDIALPRDIAPAVNNLDNVYVYDIDDLKEVVEENLAQRKEEAQKALTIVEEEAHSFELWRGSLALQPTIVEIIAKGEQIAVDEVARTMKRLGSKDPLLEEALEQMAMSILSKYNHAPLKYLKLSYRHSQGTSAIVRVRQILGLDMDNNVEDENSNISE